MIKKINVIFFVLCVFYSVNVSVYADFEDRVSRGKCVSEIVKAIGVTEKINNTYSEALFYSPIFEDVEFDENKGYIICAGYNGIANGWKYNFFSNDEATIRDAVTFMMRCLDDYEIETIKYDTTDLSIKIVKEDTDLMFQKAEALGIINKNEPYYYNMDVPLTNSVFQKLMQRFLNQKRYKYFNDNEIFIKKDEERSITYLEFLQQIEVSENIN